MLELGTKVRDSITGFEGVAISRTEYLYGCVRIGVEAVKKADGTLPEIGFFDEQRLTEESTAKTGGPGQVPPSRPMP